MDLQLVSTGDLYSLNKLKEMPPTIFKILTKFIVVDNIIGPILILKVFKKGWKGDFKK